MDEDEYLQAKKSGKSHREIYVGGLGRDYMARPIGRPAAFDPDAYEKKMRQLYINYLADYSRLHEADHEANRKALGIDVKEGAVTPPVRVGSHRRKRRGEG